MVEQLAAKRAAWWVDAKVVHLDVSMVVQKVEWMAVEMAAH